MTKTTIAIGLGLVLAVFLCAAPAQAQFFTTYVSSSGNDGNDCQFPGTACVTLQRAHAQTLNGGTILCLSSGEFLISTNITKSITIDCRGHVAKTHGIGIFAPNVVVILRGLHIYGAYGATGDGGIAFLDGNALHIEDCKIAAFGASGVAFGVRFAPSALSRLYIVDSVISENGAGDNSAGGGIFIEPAGSGAARAVLTRVTLNQNTAGIVINGTNAQRTVVEMTDSVVAGSFMNAVTVNNAGLLVNRSSVQGNLGNGILAGPNALVHIGASTVSANSLGGFAYNGGQIFSYGDNKTKGNGVDNGPSGTLASN